MTPNAFLSSLKYVEQLCLTTFFHITNFRNDPPEHPRGPRVPGGSGAKPNSLFRALRHEDFDLQSTFLAKMSSFPDYLDVTWLQTDPNQLVNIY